MVFTTKKVCSSRLKKKCHNANHIKDISQYQVAFIKPHKYPDTH